jgi:hypothetical protein
MGIFVSTARSGTTIPATTTGKLWRRSVQALKGFVRQQQRLQVNRGRSGSASRNECFYAGGFAETPDRKVSPETPVPVWNLSCSKRVLVLIVAHTATLKLASLLMLCWLMLCSVTKRATYGH